MQSTSLETWWKLFKFFFRNFQSCNLLKVVPGTTSDELEKASNMDFSSHESHEKFQKKKFRDRIQFPHTTHINLRAVPKQEELNFHFQFPSESTCTAISFELLFIYLFIFSFIRESWLGEAEEEEEKGLHVWTLWSKNEFVISDHRINIFPLNESFRLRAHQTRTTRQFFNKLIFFPFSHPRAAHFAASQIFAVQHVDVCMFSNGKFKNIVAEVDVSKQIGPGETLHGVYSLLPIRGKSWRRSWCQNEHPIHDSLMTAGAAQMYILGLMECTLLLAQMPFLDESSIM